MKVALFTQQGTILKVYKTKPNLLPEGNFSPEALITNYGGRRGRVKAAPGGRLRKLFFSQMEEYLVRMGRVTDGWAERDFKPKLNQVIRDYITTVRPLLAGGDGPHDFLILGFDFIFEDLRWGLEGLDTESYDVEVAKRRNSHPQELVLEGDYRIWLGEIQNPPGMVTPKEMYDVLVPEFFSIVDEIHDLRDTQTPKEEISSGITTMANWKWLIGGPAA